MDALYCTEMQVKANKTPQTSLLTFYLTLVRYSDRDELKKMQWNPDITIFDIANVRYDD